jgi:hypothetical protein
MKHQLTASQAAEVFNGIVGSLRNEVVAKVCVSGIGLGFGV